MAVITLVLATGNLGKVNELRALLDGLSVGVESITRFVPDFFVEETGTTFEGNALLKARASYRATNLLSLADDSGLEVDALGGRPGVHSARYAGEQATDHDNNQRLLTELAGVADAQRTARFVCALALVGPQPGDEHVAMGFAPGRILREPRGGAGFGYDPLFLCARLERSFAELSPTQKGAVGHRGQALKALYPHLERILSGGSD